MHEIMGNTIQVFVILSIFGFATVQNEQDKSLRSQFSMEFQNLTKLSNVSPDDALYGIAKKLFIENRLVNKSYVELLGAHDELKGAHCELKKLMPHYDFICALKFMKFGMTTIFEETAGVRSVQTSTWQQWPPRIQQIRTNNDWDFYELHDIGDTTNYNKWFAFVSKEPQILSFMKGNKYIVEEKAKHWRDVASNLQNNLTQYYNTLNPDVKAERYGNDKLNFLQSFAAILQRGFRLACDFTDNKDKLLDEVLQTTYPNGTSLFFDTALLYVVPRWYFPAEHIDMFNILINATHRPNAKKPKELLFIAVNRMVDGQFLTVPGKKGCAKMGYLPE